MWYKARLDWNWVDTYMLLSKTFRLLYLKVDVNFEAVAVFVVIISQVQHLRSYYIPFLSRNSNVMVTTRLDLG
jgi:hypothetical protein